MRLKHWLNPEGIGLVAETLARYGLVSSAAVAVLLGQIALALILALVAFGMFLRVWRLRRRGPRV